MSENQTIYPCIRLPYGALGDRVITCGDPARAEKIGKLLENCKCLNKNREFHSYTGLWKGVPVSVVSHGVGAGGAATAFESMLQMGVKAIIRVGTCGGMQDSVTPGTPVIGLGACRDDGVTERMLPMGYPALCDVDVIQALCKSAQEKDVHYEKGIILTASNFYPTLLGTNVKIYARAGVVALENEVAPLLVLGGIYKAKVGCILTTDAKAFELTGPGDYAPDPEMMRQALDRSIAVALDAIVDLTL